MAAAPAVLPPTVLCRARAYLFQTATETAGTDTRHAVLRKLPGSVSAARSPNCWGCR
jgi:hypothetical protein